ncbi:MAG: bifunctional hydroxymethylpyrimidine kinase/phosphomethylpyrimidine kinase [Bacteroidales bacterium]|nr:bifunctional hydroxymethylpyrimidine kinase/phosphomethylpyrimidine kinase [Bacteroidales bacterium]
MKQHKRVLTIAGSDSGGGAGIQADLKTMSALGCFGMSAITAITAQNTQGVFDIHPVPVSTIETQIKVVLDDIGADAIKIGMLHSSEVIKTVSETLKKYNIENIVLDPVMVATSGDKLLQDDAIETLVKELFPLSKVITPNIPEAEILLNTKIKNNNDLARAAKQLTDFGARSVLLKAGHFDKEELTDIFYDRETNQTIELKTKRVKTNNTHGTGCTLSSAIASFLAKGYSLPIAIKEAKNYIDNAIKLGADYKIGKGHGPVHHFYKFWE